MNILGPTFKGDLHLKCHENNDDDDDDDGDDDNDDDDNENVGGKGSDGDRNDVMVISLAEDHDNGVAINCRESY